MTISRLLNTGLYALTAGFLAVAQFRPVVPMWERITLGVLVVAIILMNVVIWREEEKWIRIQNGLRWYIKNILQKGLLVLNVIV